MNEKTLSSIVDTIQEKLGKEESGKISDSLADILVIEEANGKLIKEKESSITKLKNDKEMLIEANGNLLLKVPQVKEEDSFFESGSSKKEDNQQFDFRSVFDSKGHFNR